MRREASQQEGNTQGYVKKARTDMGMTQLRQPRLPVSSIVVCQQMTFQFWIGLWHLCQVWTQELGLSIIYFTNDQISFTVIQIQESFEIHFVLKGDLVFQFVENHYRNFIEKFSFPLDIEYGSARLSIESPEVSYSRPLPATTNLENGYLPAYSLLEIIKNCKKRSLQMKVVQQKFLMILNAS